MSFELNFLSFELKFCVNIYNDIIISFAYPGEVNIDDRSRLQVYENDALAPQNLTRYLAIYAV